MTKAEVLRELRKFRDCNNPNFVSLLNQLHSGAFLFFNLGLLHSRKGFIDYGYSREMQSVLKEAYRLGWGWKYKLKRKED